ncbi:MAG: FAD-dependent oxidoreductase, partial [Proteobacteria bacterium]|nr:FAD-dependent oxidoreductase [Pseudomonadota bacterium]
MLSTEVAVIGAGPAGLNAAIEAAKLGAEVMLIDENLKLGGQLTKQIHKFFGSEHHGAGIRGIDIAVDLIGQAGQAGVKMQPNTAVWGLYDGKVLALNDEKVTYRLSAEKIILATGASENAVAFPGWTLPGVMGAGAAQTIVNVYRVLPGRKILIVGAGNVGLIVAYQLMQAGADVVAVLEVLPSIGGYGVHASKIARYGVPIRTSHTIMEAKGTDAVESAVIVQVDERGNPIPGSEESLEVDTICIAAGLTPLTELAWIAEC